jgi:hypothetical protein
MYTYTPLMCPPLSCDCLLVASSNYQHRMEMVCPHMIMRGAKQVFGVMRGFSYYLAISLPTVL